MPTKNPEVALTRPITGGMVRSDRGSKFRSRRFLRGLARHHLVGSMGCAASRGDNTAMESFLSLLQRNNPDRCFWVSQEQLRVALVTCVERTDH